MRKLNTRMIVPPGGWRFHVESTDSTIKAADFSALVSAVSSHLSANNMKVDIPDGNNLSDVVDDWISRNVDSSFSRRIGTVQYAFLKKKPKRQGMMILSRSKGSTVLNRTLTIISEAKRFDRMWNVSYALAEERAVRMIACPLMERSAVCYSCKHLGPVSQSMGVKLKTSLDSELHVCGVLGAYMRPLAHISARALSQYFTKETFNSLPDDFWLKPELRKYYEEEA